MPSLSPQPTPDLEHELANYGPTSSSYPSSSAHGLLNGRISARRPPRRSSLPSSRPPVLTPIAKRWWKPLTALSLPFLILILYQAVHPHVPGLPALPKVHIESASGSWSSEDWFSDSRAKGGGPHGQPIEEGVADCVCGATDEGRRLCGNYLKEGLRTSRVVEGTGARVRKVLQKAREGQPLKIGILGGSGESRQDGGALSAVSACHGVHPSPHFPQGDPEGPGCYTTLVKAYFEKTFPHVGPWTCRVSPPGPA